MFCFQLALKNILTTICNYRNPCKIREGRFRYSSGMAQPDTRDVNIQDLMEDR